MSEKKNKRGNDPSTTTKLILFAKSGGRCQFEGCNENLLRDNVTLRELNNSNIAHIVASSSNGPRGADNSQELSTDIDNLMLLCKTHHKLVDDNPEEYTVESLKKMKLNQEEKVKELLDAMYYPESLIIMVEIPIKNTIPVQIDHKQTIQALRASGHNPYRDSQINFSFSSNSKYKDRQYWKEAEEQLNCLIDIQLNCLLKYNPKLVLAVFPIAPIPLIMKLGYKLGDNNGQG